MPNLRDWPIAIHFAAIIPIAAVVVATGCAAASPEPADDGRPLVLTTFTVLADMVRNVAGDAVRVESVTRVGAEIHGYEPTPDDLVRAQDADLVLRNGLGLEAWFDRFTSRVDAPTATLSDGVPAIAIDAGGHEGRPNPHAWMSTGNALVYVDNIRDALTDLAPEHADAFAANAEEYQARVTEIGDDLRERLGGLPEHQRALVTCEGAFSYLARDAGLTERYLWPVNADSEGTPQQIAAVITFVRANDVPAVFCETTVNDGAQRQVARETGAAWGGDLYVDSLSEPDGPVPTYLDLLRHDAETIAAGLTGEETRS
ncbi:metal ABC transporter substrate-binding protein [Marinitenerispora sediminis]|uniref:Metal ABC transporter substrate-binding protein n=1 Tax=Marinitenerispora sediminis TaxID=1931232 RepID=A0A368T8Z1_9ACTN|nr:metal ABC transporter substrate-binding protein [Marinitenerispora sediminis]RCV55047.1 metal ABC transporter substrate-binding protein [Marinitenerispora sediminis]RCV58012.1 metal ABC transporter substrate-binding protein [Marinitenerispora sediminis]RCV60693.1 metal ABC transporter substrate-binding protein [Marinitenerispora sediminis]